MGTITDLVVRGGEAYTDGDVEAFMATYADDAVLVCPDGRFEGKDAIREYWQMSMGAFKGDVTILSSVEQGDTYAGEFRLVATNVGPIPMPDGTELPATGKQFTADGMEIAVLRNGTIGEHRMYWDNLAAFQQLGLA